MFVWGRIFLPEVEDVANDPRRFSMATSPNPGNNSRLYLLGAMLLLWCAAICGRLVYLQVFCLTGTS